MNKWILNNTRIRQSSQYIAAAALCVLMLCFILKLWQADLRVPFFYSGDSVFWATCIKGVIENGWYWQNPAVGAPGTLQLYEFPVIDNGVMMLMWLMTVFTHNPFVVMNVFYLLSFPLVAISSLYVLRHFNLSFVPALFASLLYALTPFHFIRNQHHLFYNDYYVVPLAVMVLLWLTTELLVTRSRKFIISVLVAILLGCSGVYYPFFFCFLLLVAGAVGALKFRRLRPLLMAFVFIGITTATILINLSPSLIYLRQHGHAEAIVRNPGEAETYGLRISQLLLPITVHRIRAVDLFKRFHNSYVLVTENDSASLGAIGSIGFLVLLAQLLYRKELIANARGLFHDLSALNMFAVLLGTIGSFGLLFSLYVSPAIRCYNRISIYIAFFSLMAVAYGLESIYRRTRTTRSRSIFYLLLAVALIGGTWDQTSTWYIPTYAANKAEFGNDAEFVKRIEASIPAGSMIFQLPYIQFPEVPRVRNMYDYDHLRGYVHSRNLRWSFGSIKNRDTDRAQERVASLPPEQLVQELAFGGFTGLYLDRFGYEDQGVSLEAEFSKILQAKPLSSPNGRLLFYNLSDYGRSLRGKYSESEWEVRKELSFHPVLLDWGRGFFKLESRPGKTWRWASNDGELHIRNTSRLPRTIKLEMAFATGHPELDDFFISGFISEQLKVNETPVPYTKTITVPPGESIITFRSTARRVDAPLDSRFIVFRVEDFKMTEIE